MLEPMLVIKFFIRKKTQLRLAFSEFVSPHELDLSLPLKTFEIVSSLVITTETWMNWTVRTFTNIWIKDVTFFWLLIVISYQLEAIFINTSLVYSWR